MDSRHQVWVLTPHEKEVFTLGSSVDCSCVLMQNNRSIKGSKLSSYRFNWSFELEEREREGRTLVSYVRNIITSYNLKNVGMSAQFFIPPSFPPGSYEVAVEVYQLGSSKPRFLCDNAVNITVMAPISHNN